MTIIKNKINKFVEITKPIKHLLKVSLAGAALLALSFTGASAAPSIPCGTAKLIVPWGAGGGTDVIFRQMVEKVNKSGASHSYKS